jgi:hypothetical protein
MKTMDLKSFSLSGIKVVFPDADTAVITCQVKMKFTMGGKESAGTFNSGSVWRMKDGKWHVIFHTNVLEEKPAAAH